MMKRRGTKVVAFAAIAALALSACGDGDDPDPDPGATSPDPGATTPEGEVIVTYAAEQEFASYNNNTADQNAFRNTHVLNRVLQNFWRYGPDGFAQPNTDVGTYELVSDDPQTVEYTLNDAAVWSDNEPIDCADMLLGWAASSGVYQHPTDVDEETGDPLPLFSSAGTTGFRDWVKPDCADGDKSLTVEYENVFASWEVIAPLSMPAHIVADQGGLTKAELAQAIRDDDVEAMLDAAEFYNKGWVMDPGQLLSEDLIPSSGPYKLGEWEAGEFITMVRNENYWGTPGAADTIVFRFLDQDQQAQALENLEVDIIDPQPNPDLVNQLQRMEGIQLETGESFTYEHLDFDMSPDGIFTNRDLREAFALCVPRQLIVDNLIKPQNPEAEVLQARLTYSFMPDYADQIADTDYTSYADQDIDASRALLEANDAVGLEVRIGYQQPNPRRTNQVELIKDACDEAGFEIIDHGAEDFFGRALDEGDWDVALFAWVGSAYVSGTASTFMSPEACTPGNKGNNNGCYSNAEVDALYTELLAELNIDAQRALVKEIETILWEDIPTIPVFTFPFLAAWGDDVTGVVPNLTQGGITWNKDEWSRA